MTLVHDVAIVGGGPSASYAASYLAQNGIKNIILFERAQFPRHQIGESFLPESLNYLSEIGVLDRIEKSGFVRKPGAIFHSEKTHKSHCFYFKDALNPLYKYSYNVSRSCFDKIMLDHARDFGVHIRQPEAVHHVKVFDHYALINQQFKAKIVLHATGIGYQKVRPGNYISNLEEDQTSAIFGYYKVPTHSALNGCILVNLFYEEDSTTPQWAWAIPIDKETLSIGFVLSSQKLKAQLTQRRKTSQLIDDLLSKNPRIQALINEGQQIRAFEARYNFQRVPRKLVFDREMLIGDSAGFIDPVFSSGVLLGFKSAKMAADNLLKIFKENLQPTAENLESYEAAYRKEFLIYYRFVKMFYQRNIVEKLFLSPGQFKSIPLRERMRQVTSILAGDLQTENGMIQATLNSRLSINPEITKILYK